MVHRLNNNNKRNRNKQRIKTQPNKIQANNQSNKEHHKIVIQNKNKNKISEKR